jgi:hypothetical protein
MSGKEEAMNKKCSVVITVGLVLIAFALAGCGHDALKKNWGSAYESAKQSQIANPDASNNLEPVVGLDGAAAEKAIRGYQQGSCDKDKGDTYNLRLGTIEGIGEKK